jgi:curved DNA-binding protein CbpA
VSREVAGDPFRALGLEPGPGLTDDEVHAAWRRTASATHPDREDGGDPQRFADAAAAYTVLRTRFGRGEALADLNNVSSLGRRAGRRRSVMGLFEAQPAAAAARLLTRARHGRPGRLALRVAAAVAASAAAVAAAGPHPAAPALVTGVATWLVLTARHDLAPRSGSRRG